MQLTITRPDDWHVHLRDGSMLATVLPDTARRYGRALAMPNLRPPVSTTKAALEYRARILRALPAGLEFEPLMALYLTDDTDPAEVRRARESGVVRAMKLYPAGATTNSAEGVTSLEKIYPVLEAMQEIDFPLSVHAETTDPDVDVFDREGAYIERQLCRIVDDFPALRVIFEHVSSREGVEYVVQARDAVAATVTAHHLLLNRNDIFAGGISPHFYCLPVIKSEADRQALVRAATSGNPRFFAGTDSAPHPRTAKERARGAGGIYTARASVELYAEAFEDADALDKLEGFLSFHGADFYGLPRNAGTITLVRREQTLPASIPLDGDELIPLRAGETIRWRLG